MWYSNRWYNLSLAIVPIWLWLTLLLRTSDYNIAFMATLYAHVYLCGAHVRDLQRYRSDRLEPISL